MATTLSQVIPPLRNIQTMLEDYYLNYGNDILYYGDKLDNKKPKQYRNEAFMFNIARMLVSYKHNIKSIKDTEDFIIKRTSAFRALTIIVILIVCIVLSVEFGKYYFIRKRKSIEEKYGLKKPQSEESSSSSQQTGDTQQSAETGVTESASTEKNQKNQKKTKTPKI